MKPISTSGSVYLPILLLFLVAGCSDDDPAAPPQTGSGVIAITVDETSVWPNDLGYVFTSALDGTVLDSATWDKATVLELKIPSALGTGFYVTQVHDQDGPDFFLDTRQHLAAKENELDLRRDNYSPESRKAEILFENIPPHDSYTLGTGYDWVSGEHLANSIQVEFSHEPVDVLITIGEYSAPRSYQWVPGVTDGSQHVVDLNDLQSMQKHTVLLPAEATDLTCYLLGVKFHTDGVTKLHYLLDTINFGYTTPNSWEAGTIDSDFTRYTVSGYWEKYPYLNPKVSTTTEGGLPAELVFWDLDITIADSDRDACRIEISGPVDGLDLMWGGGFGGDPPPFWMMRNLEASPRVVLPRLPQDLATLVPELDRDKFYLVNVTAIREMNGLAGDGITPMTTRDRVLQYNWTEYPTPTGSALPDAHIR